MGYLAALIEIFQTVVRLLIIPGKVYHPFQAKVYHLRQDELVSKVAFFLC